MANSYFNFKQFRINQEKSAFKVSTDGVLLGACADIAEVRSVLDIGTGTGLIAIMVAQRCDAEIDAVEPDYDSWMQACENVAECPWNNRIKVIHSNLLGFDPGEKKYDLIVSNPPYFSDSLKSPDLKRSSARHNDSLTTEELLNGVSRLLDAKGRFQIILPYVEGSIFIADAQKSGFYCNKILKIKPLPASEIRRLIMIFSRERLKVTERFLTIECGKRHEFTEEYINLTRDFYLKF